MTIGVVSAMREELSSLLPELGQEVETVRTGMRTYRRGRLWGAPVVVVFSRLGKVASSSTVTQLISQFGVDEVVFTGVAGAVDPDLSVGDVVVARHLYQHDMDARPLFARHELPLLGETTLETDPHRRQAAVAAAREFLRDDLRSHVAVETLREFQIDQPKLVEGDVASGDKFFSKAEDREELRERLPSVACVEMEGAAVAQVCHEHGVPSVVLRTISDAANEAAPIDFQSFLEGVASAYSHGILARLVPRLHRGDSGIS